jgi:hypothetical protein
VLPKKLVEAFEAVKKTKYEDAVVYTAFAVERDKYLGATKKKDPLEQCKVVVQLSRDSDGSDNEDTSLPKVERSTRPADAAPEGTESDGDGDRSDRPSGGPQVE